MQGGFRSTTARLQDWQERILYGPASLCYLKIVPWKPESPIRRSARGAFRMGASGKGRAGAGIPSGMWV
jgi:hypothetical protein